MLVNVKENLLYFLLKFADSQTLTGHSKFKSYFMHILLKIFESNESAGLIFCRLKGLTQNTCNLKIFKLQSCRIIWKNKNMTIITAYTVINFYLFKVKFN